MTDTHSTGLLRPLCSICAYTGHEVRLVLDVQHATDTAGTTAIRRDIRYVCPRCGTYYYLTTDVWRLAPWAGGGR